MGHNLHRVRAAWAGFHLGGALALGYLLLPGFAALGLAQSPADLFSARPQLTGDKGQVTGSNVGATLEPGEPQHGHKPGGHSVWISWTAPATGIVTFDTAGSSFDTLISAYRIDPQDPNKPIMDRLIEVAESDDDAGQDGIIQFGVAAGTSYEVAVDGYRGATGNVRLQWDLLSSDKPVPIILSNSGDRSLRVGDTLVLAVNYQTTEEVKLAWLFNGEDLSGAESSTLTIPNFQPSNVGQYRLRITVGKVRLFSAPIEVQVNSEGETATLARDKLLDASESALHGRDDRGGTLRGEATPSRRALRLAGAGAIGVARGYNGTQIFSTTFARREADEPVHCGLPGGATYWFAYQPPESGALALDTDGSSFDTLLAVYTFEPPLLGYANLIPLACDNNSGANGLTSRIQLDVTAGRTYFVVVDGVNGARGDVQLNYALARRQTLSSPSIVRTSGPSSVVVGEAATFGVEVTGTPPFSFAWLKDNLALVGETNAQLVIPAARTDHAGQYVVVVSNPAGSASSSPMVLSVLSPPSFTAEPGSGAVAIGAPFLLEVTVAGTPPLFLQWFRDGVRLEGETNRAFGATSAQAVHAGTYHVEVSNAVGRSTSSPANLRVLSPPAIDLGPASQTALAGEEVSFAALVSGSLPIAVQWSHDGEPIAGATNLALQLAGLHPRDAGVYSLMATNEVGTATSQPVRLEVLAPVRVSRGPDVRTLLLHFPVARGTPFVVETAGSLSAPVWTNLISGTASNELLQFLVPLVASEPERFYRFRVR